MHHSLPWPYSIKSPLLKAVLFTLAMLAIGLIPSLLSSLLVWLGR